MESWIQRGIVKYVFNGKYKRRAPPINVSVRDKGLLVIAVGALKRMKK